MKRFVLDASIALAWFLDRPLPPYAGRVRQLLQGGARAVVPALWHLEMANGLAVAERRKILDAADAARCLVHIEELLAQSIETESDLFRVRQVLEVARAFGLSAYDAVYLETARRGGFPLATLDQQLRAAAARGGVSPVELK